MGLMLFDLPNPLSMRHCLRKPLFHALFCFSSQLRRTNAAIGLHWPSVGTRHVKTLCRFFSAFSQQRNALSALLLFFLPYHFA